MNPLTWLNGVPRQRTGIALFQRAIGGALVFRVLTEWPFAEYLWGPHSLATQGAVAGWLGIKDAPVEAFFSTVESTYACLAILLLAGCGLLFQYWTRLSCILGFAAFTLLGARLPELNDGGDNLATLALLYMMFVLPARSHASPRSLRAWIHNLAVVAICVQVCIVYFVAGFMKMYGASWHNGTALFLISQVEWFSLPRTRAWFANPIIATASTYSTMIFQVWFPVAMLSRFKFAFLALAMFFHLGIAVTMGLLTFSVVMAGADLSLITDDEYQDFQAWWQALRAKVAAFRHLRVAPALLFLDGDCEVCRSFGRQVARIKSSGPTTILSIRETDSYAAYGISAQDVERRMHLVVADANAVLSGFEVLVFLACRAPLLWPAVPVLYLIGVLGLGDPAYRAFAARRYMWNSSSCTEQCIPPR